VCYAHREIQRSFRALNPLYRPPWTVYHFNNAVVHNAWAFPHHLVNISIIFFLFYSLSLFSPVSLFVLCFFSIPANTRVWMGWQKTNFYVTLPLTAKESKFSTASPSRTKLSLLSSKSTHSAHPPFHASEPFIARHHFMLMEYQPFHPHQPAQQNEPFLAQRNHVSFYGHHVSFYRNHVLQNSNHG
jgi:hypothetical protein